MVKLVLARQLAGKSIIANDGEALGRAADILMNERNGRLEAIAMEPNPDSAGARKLKKEPDGYVYVPYSAVLAAGDFIIIDRKTLGI